MTIRRRKLSLAEVRVFIAAASLAGTLGLWNLFANDSIAEASLDSVPALSATQQGGAPALKLPPMPTLVPPLPKNSFTSDQPVSAEPQGLSSASSQPTTIFLGGSEPQARSSGPAARTGSSR